MGYVFTCLPVYPSTCLPSIPDTMKILIAGFGSIGRRHFRNLKALGVDNFVFLRSAHSTLPDDAIADYPVETDIPAALAHQPDAVIVSNPTALHLAVAIPAAEAGCNLFLEKPVSYSLDGIAELQAAIRRSGVQVLVGFQFRLHPGLEYIKSLLTHQQSTITNQQSSACNSQLTIGRPLSVRAHWGEYLPGWHPWEDYRQGYSARSDLGGGVVLTLCHPLDYLRWLLGEVEALWAFTSQNSDLELSVEDTAEIGLRYVSGVIGSVHLNYTQQPPKHELEIVGTQGTIRWDNADGVVRVYQAEVKQEWQEYPVPEDFERNDLFLAQMRHFLAVVRGEAEPACTLDDGVKALELALAVHQSATEGRLVHLARDR
jgi:predicted dehydrogenase